HPQVREKRVPNPKVPPPHLYIGLVACRGRFLSFLPSAGRGCRQRSGLHRTRSRPFHTELWLSPRKLREPIRAGRRRIPSRTTDVVDASHRAPAGRYASDRGPRSASTNCCWKYPGKHWDTDPPALELHVGSRPRNAAE